jgi:hypothetical protein
MIPINNCTKSSMSPNANQTPCRLFTHSHIYIYLGLIYTKVVFWINTLIDSFYLSCTAYLHDIKLMPLEIMSCRKSIAFSILSFLHNLSIKMIYETTLGLILGIFSSTIIVVSPILFLQQKPLSTRVKIRRAKRISFMSLRSMQWDN